MVSKSSKPKISVVMPVYNAEKFLREAIDSVLRQTFSDFELIIINDGSSDKSQEIINHYKQWDSRIVSVTQDNRGVVATANRAMRMAKGEYIARMDADDVSFSDRLRQQALILDKHPKTVLVCSNFEVFNDTGEFCYREIVPPNNREIKRALYIRNPIANGSTLIRKTALEKVGYFNEVFAEDFQMWMRLSKEGDFESTGTTLYRWRMNPNGLTLTNNTLSVTMGKEYIEALWNEGRPVSLSRKQIVAISTSYFRGPNKHGIEFKEMFLTDLSQMAAKLFLHGYYLEGIKQLLAVASTGRTGLKIAMKRLHLIGSGHYNKLRKKVPFGRESYDTDH
jgi:glycosyltransferase involved in cell wall biosynthesis